MSARRDPIFESPLGGLSHEGDISIHDLTNRHRWGLRGKGAAKALRTQDWDLPEQPNRLVASINQCFVMALSEREFWVLDPHNDAAELTTGNDFTTDAYPLFCQSSHAWLVLKGSQI
jgi:sarcosine oxidase subunit gamma